ncbi:hypothetical protein [Synechococcus phage S-B68]|nr:hypothetical protein [Synechococcus phage S-B68]
MRFFECLFEITSGNSVLKFTLLMTKGTLGHFAAVPYRIKNIMEQLLVCIGVPTEQLKRLLLRLPCHFNEVFVLTTGYCRLEHVLSFDYFDSNTKQFLSKVFGIMGITKPTKKGRLGTPPFGFTCTPPVL